MKTTLFDSTPKAFGVCQVLLLALAAALQYGTTTGYHKVMERWGPVPAIYQYWLAVLLVVSILSFLILVFGIYRCWKTDAVDFLPIIAQAISLLLSVREIYVLFSGLDVSVGIENLHFNYTIYEYYSALAFSIIFLGILYAKHAKTVTPPKP